MRLTVLISIVVFAVACASPAPTADARQPTVPGSFSTAKKKAFKDVYFDHKTSFYCNCKFEKLKTIDRESCGYEPRKDNDRAKRIEWEHVVPASRFGRTRSCWIDRKSFNKCKKDDGKFLGGRACCRKVDKEFKKMEADLMNLRPALGELNGNRSDLPFGEIEGEDRVYGDCDFEVQGGLAEPEAKDRGEVARAYLYFERVWGMKLSEEERELFQIWNEEDKPDSWEKNRNTRIKAIQGMGNPFIENHGRASSCIPRSQCCRVCGKSQACGDSCIGASLTCRKDPGCACAASQVCD